jgi:putative toxin-antitoxin system antitoxin component (TIGR02293 family)
MKQAIKARSARAGKGGGAFRAPAKKPTPPPRKVVQVMPAGLGFGELEALREQLDLSMDQLIAKLGLARATLHRRKTTGRLTTDESDKVVRFARLLGHAVHLFGGLDQARQWLKTPQRELGGAVPLDRAQTEDGAREVENLLDRIGYGV